jgi:hypothetical protein
MNINKKYLIIISLIAFILFLYSMELTSFSGYTILSFILISILLYFGLDIILKMIMNGNSIIFIISMIFLMSIISIIIWGLFKIYENRKNINNKWPQYRCKPYILPFAGWLIGPSDVSPTKNFIDCLWNINKSFFDVLISPFTDMIKMITDILKNIVVDIQNIRKMITFMRDNMEEMAKDILDKIWASYVRIAYLFKTVLKIFEQLGKVFLELFDVLKFSTYTVASMWNGPIGSVSNFFCFDENTLIKMNNKKEKKIKNIELKDILENDNEIIAIYKFTSENVEMYNYNDILVSGKHPVFENGKWIRIDNSKFSKKIYNYNKPFIYCLATKNATIKINNILFSDYNEIPFNDNKNNNKIFNFILNNINKSNINKLNNNYKLISGFDESTYIKMRDGNIKKIKDININDETKYGKILGKILIKNKLPLYQYNNIILSNNIILKKNNKWIPIDKLKNNEIKKINDNERILYNIITEKHKIEINNNIFTDYEIIEGEDLLDELNKCER